MYNTIEEYFSIFNEQVDLKPGHPIKGPIQYHFTDEDWYLEIVDNDVVPHKGISEDPVSEIEISTSDYLDLKNKKITWGPLVNSRKVIFKKDMINILSFNKYIK